MKAETWLPLATLALGWAGAQLTELFRDRRISSRERRTRQEASQRATLLDLPRRAAGAVQPDDGDQRRSPPELLWRRMTQDQKTEWSAREHQARAHLWDLRAKVQLLESRVLDADARHAVAVFVAISQLAIPWARTPPKRTLWKCPSVTTTRSNGWAS
jgi:hypothetical protein